MLLQIAGNLKGYVVIEVTGFSIERFINMTVHKNILLRDVVRTDGKATMKVSVDGFRMLKPIARKSRCKVKIKAKRGVPFIIYRYRRRKALILGALLFVAILYTLSSFVWLVEVEGNSRVASERITEFLADNGLKEGTLKFGVDTRSLEKQLMYYFGDISFIHIDITGTKATVKIAETIEKKDIVDTEAPCDVIASKDGLITSISTSAGTPIARPGDMVKEGDVLVSGRISIGTPEEEIRSDYVHAYADVRAKIFYEIEFLVPYTYYVKEYTGQETKNRYCILFDKTINLINPSIFYESYDKIIERHQLKLTDMFPLPAVFVTEGYREFILSPRARTDDEARLLADKAITSRIIREFGENADILDKKITFTDLGDNLHARCMLTTVEHIGAELEVYPGGEPRTPPNERTD